MNYYERHLGDYAKDAGHLSMLEDGAYQRLLDRYYATEQGIPADQAHRVARARTDDEKVAVDAVLSEFFTLIEGVWVNQRAEHEIEKARARIKAAQENGKKGGRPKANPEETDQKPDGFSVGSENETQPKALHVPSTSLQLPTEKPRETAPPQKRGSRLPPDWAPSAELIEWAKAERPDLNTQTEMAKFRDHWLAKPGKDGTKLDWDATWRNWIRGAKGGHTPRAGPQKPSTHGGFDGLDYGAGIDDKGRF